MTRESLMRHLRADGHIVLGHGNIVMRFKRGDDTWAKEVLEASHEELHASIDQLHTHRAIRKRKPMCETCQGTGYSETDGVGGTICPDCGGSGLNAEQEETDATTDKREDIAAQTTNHEGNPHLRERRTGITQSPVETGRDG